MSRRIIFATGNKNKMVEIREILNDPSWEILSMKEAGIDIDIVEDGNSFEENALIKAKAVAAVCDDIVLADDSGLEIDYLGGEPGIYSSRYAGEDTSYDIKNQLLLSRMEGVSHEKRTARFVCAVAAVVPGHEPVVVRGTIEGYIGDKPAGENGFGYDPIFYVEDKHCSTAQLSPEEKNSRSHRGNALRLMREKLRGMGI
ncbi:MAG: XTP/dITP diphosphatase [Clostridiales bacterium]|nr:XTP/dITP diphosphatase [Clostridiales bacterium]